MCSYTTVLTCTMHHRKCPSIILRLSSSLTPPSTACARHFEQAGLNARAGTRAGSAKTELDFISSLAYLQLTTRQTSHFNTQTSTVHLFQSSVHLPGSICSHSAQKCQQHTSSPSPSLQSLLSSFQLLDSRANENPYYRGIDPIFAVTCGIIAAGVRINREEKEKGRTTQETVGSFWRRWALVTGSGRAEGVGAKEGGMVKG